MQTTECIIRPLKPGPLKPGPLALGLIMLGLSLCWLPSSSAEQPGTRAVEGLVEHAARHPDGQSPFSFEQDAYRGDLRHLPIGVFDSGIGGLTVLEAILAMDAHNNDTLRPGSDGRADFENESFVYFGDQANMPYGNYAALGKVDFLRELILKDATFLLGRRYWPTADAARPAFDKPAVKAIVIACNTATAYGLDDIRAAIDAWKIPVFVVGVVEAGARGVNEAISATDPPRTVAVLATVGTCASLAYPKAIGRATGLAGKRLPHVIQHGSYALAGAIEGDAAFLSVAAAPPQTLAPQTLATQGRPDPLYGFHTDQVIGNLEDAKTLRLRSVQDYVQYDVATLMETYRKSGGTQPVDTIVLGCTHFPLVRDEILAAFERLRNLEWNGKDEKPFHSLIASQIQVIDPAELTAKELFRALASAGLRRSDHQPTVQHKDAFFISVPSANWPSIKLEPDGSLQADYKYGRQAGQLSIEDTRAVPLRPSMLPDASLRLIQTRLPKVWQRVK